MTGSKGLCLTGWPDVSMLWLGETASLICSFCLCVAAHTIVYTDLFRRYTLCAAQTFSNQETNQILLLVEVRGSHIWLTDLWAGQHTVLASDAVLLVPACPIWIWQAPNEFSWYCWLVVSVYLLCQACFCLFLLLVNLDILRLCSSVCVLSWFVRDWFESRWSSVCLCHVKVKTFPLVFQSGRTALEVLFIPLQITLCSCREILLLKICSVTNIKCLFYVDMSK